MLEKIKNWFKEAFKDKQSIKWYDTETGREELLKQPSVTQFVNAAIEARVEIKVKEIKVEFEKEIESLKITIEERERII